MSNLRHDLFTPSIQPRQPPGPSSLNGNLSNLTVLGRASPPREALIRESSDSPGETEDGTGDSSDEEEDDEEEEDVSDEDESDDASPGQGLTRSPIASDDDDELAETLGLGFALPNISRRSVQIDEKPSGRGTGTIRGPRKAAEPTGDIKLRLSQATEAFIAQDYLVARDIICEVIRINAETYEAWIMLSSIDRELGDVNNSVSSFAFAQTLRPKDIEGWIKAANYALAQTDGSRAVFLDSAFYCFSSAIRANISCIEARFGKAGIKVERGNLKGAISDYSRILKYSPHNLDAVRSLGAVYFDHNEVGNAKQLYKSTFDYLKSPENNSQHVMDWNDVATYVALFEHEHSFLDAIIELRSLARWLLGRESEEFFDTFIDNDCEWDEDDSRRKNYPEFSGGVFSQELYGPGLPIALRVRMGLCRLKLGHNEEAIRHLDHLGNWERADEEWVVEYQHFYVEAAESLQTAGLHQNALLFYQSLKQVPKLATASVYIQMAKCFQGNSLDFKAEECFQAAIQLDDNNIEARIELAKMYDALNQQEQAFIFVNEAMDIERRNQAQNLSRPKPRKRYRRKGDPPRLPPEPSNGPSFMAIKRPRTYKPSRLADPTERLKEADDRAEELERQYLVMQTHRDSMLLGDKMSNQRWLEAAKDLTDDFRGCKSFYHWDKFAKFLGYNKEAREQAETPLNSQLTTMADQLSQNLGGDVSNELKAQTAKRPSDYRGISFKAWLDIFLEYALCLARTEKKEQAYDICEAAKDSTIYSHSHEDVFLIHVAWCTCAILTGDESTCVSIARNFMKDHSASTDSYKMFAAATRMCNSPIQFYKGDSSQKYLLRQVKAIDSSLLEDNRNHPSSSLGSDKDIALLMLYGHVLYSSQSYTNAFSYFFRALALDPENPIINLNIGLTYAQHALKRDAENRQYLILQSMTFLFAYYDSRKESSYLSERQEAHYNVSRLYSMLGLTHLAIPYYLRVLEESARAMGEPEREDLVTDAAYNLQTIYTMAGNQRMADAITAKWLVV